MRSMTTDRPRAAYTAAQRRLLETYELNHASTEWTIEDPIEQLHVLRAGTGPPAVFFHGLGVTATTFVPLLAAVADRVDGIAVDRPGRGLSDPHTYRRGELRSFLRQLGDQVLDTLEQRSVTLVGHSFGGFQALAYALDRPDRVDRLVLLGAPAGLSRTVSWDYRLVGEFLSAPFGPPMALGTRNGSTRDEYSPVLVADPAALDGDLVATQHLADAMPRQRASRNSLVEAMTGFRGLTDEMLLRDSLADLDVPTLFVWGSADVFHPPSLGQSVADTMSRAECVVLDGAGHAPWLEPDNAVASTVAEFVTGDTRLDNL